MMISQVMRRYKELKFSWKLARRAFYFAFFIVAIAFFYRQFISAHYFPITEVRIAGATHIDHKEMQQLVTPLVNQGFLNVHVEEIRERLLQLSWVKDAFVRRVWPNEVTIELVEKTPLARWNVSHLLSDSGEIFSPDKSTFPEGLMIFVGPQGEQMEMIKNYTKMDEILKPLHFAIARLELTPAHIFNVTFTNGINLRIEEKDILTRLPHFVKVYPEIVGDRVANVDYVDLRYINGLVVRWKTVT